MALKIERELDKDTSHPVALRQLQSTSEAAMKQLPLPAGAIFGKGSQMNDWEATIVGWDSQCTLCLLARHASPELAAQRQKQVLERMLRCATSPKRKSNCHPGTRSNRVPVAGENLSECCHH